MQSFLNPKQKAHVHHPPFKCSTSLYLPRLGVETPSTEKRDCLGGRVCDAACGKCYRSTGCVTSERKWQTLTHKHFANYYVL